jgi:hypothetical protein
MPAGTIDLTNGSNKVSGSGTSFSAELKAGDFIYVNVGGAPYTIVASSVVSDVEITLSEAFTGPSSTELSWNSVPALLQMAITQKVINDFAQVARGRILDFENWQGIYSDEPSVTVTRPDRTQFTGPSWGHIAKVVGAVEDPLTNLVPLSRQYMTLAAAQADIANIPVGSATFVRSSDDNALALEYMNTSGTLTATGRKMPSQLSVNADMAVTTTKVNAINQILGLVTPPGYKIVFNDNTGSFTVGITDAGVLSAGNADITLGNISNLVSSLASINSAKIGGVSLGTDPQGNALTIYDALYQICVQVSSAGALSAGTATINNLTALNSLNLPGGTTVGSVLPSGFVAGFIDTLYQLSAGLKSDGTWAMGSASAVNLNVTNLTAANISSPALTGASTPKPLKKLLADVVHIVSYGQSLSCGINGMPLQTTSALYNAIKFNGGVRAQDGGASSSANHASFQPFIETFATTPDGDGYETLLGGCIKMLYDLTVKENYGFTNTSMKVLGSAPGEGGQQISSLSQYPGAYMQRVKDDLTYGYSLAQAGGKTYEPLAMLWIQGEANQAAGTTATDYITAFASMMTQINSFAATVMGSAFTFPVFTYQFASWMNWTVNNNYPVIPLALSALAETRDDVVLATAIYMLPHYDRAHLTGPGYKIFGAYQGLAIKRTVLDGTKFTPLKPVDHLVQGNLITARFNPVGGLVMDTSIVSDPGNYGFSLVDSSGNALTISSVTCKYDTVTIAASAAIPAGAKLRYGFVGGTVNTNPGPTTGPRGCLRDSQGDTIIFDPTGVNWAMHNYCIIFELSL